MESESFVHLMELFQMVELGVQENVVDNLKKLSGHEPRKMRKFIQEHVNILKPC